MARYRDELALVGYEGLKIAVVKQAASDYQKAKFKLLLNPEDKEAKHQVQSLRQWFLSEYYTFFSSVDGEYLLRMLDENL